MSPQPRLVSVFLRAIVRRPSLIVEAIRFALATASPDWFRRRPFLPIPDPAYREWRMSTAYGDGGPEMSVAEVEDFLEWRRRMRRARTA